MVVSSCLCQLRRAELRQGDFAVDAAGLHQFGVRPHADCFAAIQDNDLVGVANGADALCDDDFGGVVKRCGKPFAEFCIGAVVQRRE